MPTIASGALLAFSTELLAAGGIGRSEAACVAEGLVGANLRGHDSHGVMRIPYYLGQIEKQEVFPGRTLKILREGPALIVADGQWGLGRPLAQDLTARLMRKAQAGGVGVGTLRCVSHIGRLGDYCEQAAAAGMLTVAMVNSHGAVHRVAPPGGKASRLSTNPIAFGVPHAEGPLVADFSTSATAEGKVRVKKIAGQPCPDGWLVDCEGRPTTDAAALYANPPGAILPMGGPQMYKGFGLGLMVEIFSGALSGGVCSREKPINQLGNCVFLMILDPAQFGGTDHFAHEVADLVAFVRGCPRAEGVAAITLPGDPERHVLAERTAHGIPFDDENWAALTRLAARLGVAVPA